MALYILLPSTTSTNTTMSMRETVPVKFALDYIRAPKTREHYRQKLKVFFDYLGLQGNSIKEQGKAFRAHSMSYPLRP